MEPLWTDLRYSVRTLLKARSFTPIAVITLAFGIGATTAMFSLVNAVLLKPLPYPDPGRLVVLVNTRHGQVSSSPFVSAPRMNAWRGRASSVRDITAYFIGAPVNLAAGGQPQQVVAGRVTASFFRLFGARLAAGGTFTTEEDKPGGRRAVILSAGFWHRQWGGDPAIVGQTVAINGEPFTVTGILDRQFDPRSVSPALVAVPDVWISLQLDPNTRDVRTI